MLTTIRREIEELRVRSKHRRKASQRSRASTAMELYLHAFQLSVRSFIPCRCILCSLLTHLPATTRMPGSRRQLTLLGVPLSWLTACPPSSTTNIQPVTLPPSLCIPHPWLQTWHHSIPSCNASSPKRSACSLRGRSGPAARSTTVSRRRT